MKSPIKIEQFSVKKLYSNINQINSIEPWKHYFHTPLLHAGEGGGGKRLQLLHTPACPCMRIVT